MFELHAHRLAVHLGEVLFGLPDGAHSVYEGPGDPVVQGVAGDGLQFVQLPVVQVEAGRLLELGASGLDGGITYKRRPRGSTLARKWP